MIRPAELLDELEGSELPPPQPVSPAIHPAAINAATRALSVVMAAFP
jgi:hypothetical protein